MKKHRLFRNRKKNSTETGELPKTSMGAPAPVCLPCKMSPGNLDKVALKEDIAISLWLEPDHKTDLYHPKLMIVKTDREDIQKILIPLTINLSKSSKNINKNLIAFVCAMNVSPIPIENIKINRIGENKFLFSWQLNKHDCFEGISSGDKYKKIFRRWHNPEMKRPIDRRSRPVCVIEEKQTFEQYPELEEIPSASISI